MTRVLFVTPHYSYFTQPVTLALKQLGFEVKIFDYYKPNLTSRLIGLANNLKLVSKLHLSTLINQSLIRAVDKFKPNYLLVMTLNIFRFLLFDYYQMPILYVLEILNIFVEERYAPNLTGLKEVMASNYHLDFARCFLAFQKDRSILLASGIIYYPKCNIPKVF